MSRAPLYDPERGRKASIVFSASLSARIALWAEAIVVAFWPLATWVAACFAVMLLSLPSLFGETGWMILGAMFWAGVGYFSFKALRQFKKPTNAAVFRRVQNDSQLTYRPLEVLSDVPSGSLTSNIKKFWQLSVKQSETDVKKIRKSWPALCAAAFDRAGLRLMAAIALIAGFIVAGPHSHDRILQGMLPFGGLGSSASLSLTVWIDPPDYTRIGDIVVDQFPNGIADNVPVIPEGSLVQVTVSGLWGPADVTIGKFKIRLREQDGDSRMAHFVMPDLSPEDTVSKAAATDKTEGSQTAFIIPPFEDGSQDAPETGPKGRMKMGNLVRDFARLDFTYRPDASPVIAWADGYTGEALKPAAVVPAPPQGHPPMPQPRPGPISAPGLDLPPLRVNDLFDAPERETPRFPESAPESAPDSRRNGVPDFGTRPRRAGEGRSSEDAQRPYGMAFPVTVLDDYGVRNLVLKMELSPDVIEGPRLNGDNTLQKTITTAPGQSLETDAFFDTSFHPWSGLPVMVSIGAADEAGQTDFTIKRPFVLKEREFTQLLARRLIDLRRKLIWQGTDAIRDVSFDLLFQLKYPEDMRHSSAIWLGIKTAEQRLRAAKTDEDVQGVVNLLWAIALELEDNGISNAASALQDATNAISRALRRGNVDSDKMAGLFNRYRDALSTYLDKLRQLGQERDTRAMDLPPEILQDLLDPGPLEDMFAQMEDLMATGDYRSMEDMIARMQQLLESFALGGGMPPDLQAMAKGLNVMQGLIDNQKTLLSQTEELAEQVPQSATIPPKDFGTLLDPDTDVTRSWNQGDMPPVPQLPGVPLMPNPFGPEEENDEDLSAILPESEMQGTPEDPTLPEDQTLSEQDMNAQDMGEDLSEDMAENMEPLGDELFPATPLPQPEIFDDTLPLTDDQVVAQEVMRFILGEVMGEVFNFTNELNENLPMAELEMRNSTETLDRQRPDESVPIQEEVIRLLEQAQKDMQDQMREAMQQGQDRMRMGQGRDPLGRPQGREDDGEDITEDSDVEVPESFERKRVDDILEYLRKHAGDPDRPKAERDYFQRLLRQY